MTKKHFEAIAGLLKSVEFACRVSPDEKAEARHRLLCKSFADLFSEENPRFDRARFLKACGVTE